MLVSVFLPFALALPSPSKRGLSFPSLGMVAKVAGISAVAAVPALIINSSANAARDAKNQDMETEIYNPVVPKAQ